MVVELKATTSDSIDKLLAKFSPRPKKTLAAHYGKLKRGIDGLEYQKTVRNEWN